MPNYDYQCDTCGNTFEIFQSMKAKRLSRCPDKTCGGKITRLLGTGAGLIFKGSGFYITDYRSESYKQGASKESKASESAASNGSAKTGEGKAAKTEAAKPAAAAAAKGKAPSKD